MSFPLCLLKESRGFHVVSLMFMWFPSCLHWETWVYLWFPSRFTLETWGLHVVSPYLPYGETTMMETPWNFAVNLWFPCGFRYVSHEGKSLFSPTVKHMHYFDQIIASKQYHEFLILNTSLQSML